MPSMAYASHPVERGEEWMVKDIGIREISMVSLMALT